jgi:Arc/MetJ-type ribon-helix-helix transcriptional regulator
METDSAKQTVEIPSDLHSAIQSKVRRTEFDSVDEYIVYVLEEVVAASDDESAEYNDVDEEEVQDRLKSLGYLNE